MKFVIHRHVTTPEHFDLMLEAEEVLLTWQLSVEAMEGLVRGRRVEARQIQDHRKKYLSYEGPISCDRGSISIFDSGEYRRLKEKGNTTEYFFSGKELQGRILFTENEKETLLQFFGADCL